VIDAVYVVLGTIKVRPEHLDEFLEHVRAHAAVSEREPGCVRFEVLQDVADPLTVCLIEVFRSEHDLHLHREQDYYRRWMEMSRDWRDHASYSRRVLRHVYPPDEYL
jgi:autoinducer 2-degrading protein